MEDINYIERQLSSPEKISSKALRYLLGELAVMESMSEPERIEEAIARIEYQLRLREGQGY